MSTLGPYDVTIEHQPTVPMGDGDRTSGDCGFGKIYDDCNADDSCGGDRFSPLTGGDDCDG